MNFGELNNRVNRLKQHFSTLTFIQVTALTIDRWGWHWWYLFSLVLLYFVSRYDSSTIFPKELDYINRSNTMFMKMYNKIMGTKDEDKP